MRALVAALGIVAAIVVEGACGSPPDVESPDGSRWILQSLDGRSPIDGSFVTLKVDGNRVGGFDGCNWYGARSEDGTPFARSDGTLSIPPVGSTARDCHTPDGVIEQAEAYKGALPQSERFHVLGDRLEVFGSEDEPRMVFTRQTALPGQPVDLVGTTWRIPSDSDKGSDARAATIAFLDDRLASGLTACRGYLATYSASTDGAVDFTGISMVRSQQSCPDEGRTLEGGFTDFLSSADEYSVHEDTGSKLLTIRGSEGETLTFEPLPPSVESVSDTEWSLQLFVELRGDGSGTWFSRRTPVLPGTEVTISFDEAVLGLTGCSTYHASLIVEESAIKLESVSRKEKECADPAGVIEEVRRFLDRLPKLRRFLIYGDRLSIQTGDDTFLLFQAE